MIETPKYSNWIEAQIAKSMEHEEMKTNLDLQVKDWLNFSLFDLCKNDISRRI